MTTLYLIRHGCTDVTGVSLIGRTPGIHLNELGRGQAQSLIPRLSGIPFSAIYSSPLERTMETAQPLAAALGLAIQVRDEISEIDFGAWTGRPFTELGNDPGWSFYNSFRSVARIPDGEDFLSVQSRMVRCLESIRSEHPDGHIAAFSHADPLKTVIAHYTGFHIDAYSRFQIFPASVSVVRVDSNGPSLVTLNHTGNLELVDTCHRTAH
jgi:probable phosphomutase (TIGR03848 family)